MKQGIHAQFFYGVQVIVVLVCIAVFFIPYTSHGAVGINAQIPFSGVLRDASGTEVDGTEDMVFKIYDAPTGGTLLWTGTHTAGNGNAVTVEGGAFTVLLGSGTGNALTLDFNDDTYYLGVTVGADAEMTPRERLGASGYAVNSNLLDGLDASAFLQAGSMISLTAGGLGVDVSGFANGIFGLNGGTTTDIDTEAELETALGGLNILSSGDISTSLELATLLSDESGTGTVVFNTDSVFSGLTTLGNYSATNGTTTYASSTNFFSTSLTATNAYFTNLVFGNTGGVLITDGNGGVSATTSLTITGPVTASHVIGTDNILNSLQGPLELLSTDASYIRSDLNFEDTAGILFGYNGLGNGIRIFQDIANYGDSDLAIEPPLGSTYVNLTTSGELWLMANNADGSCTTTGCEPSLILAEDGSATISNLNFGTDKYFTMNFTDGVRIPTGWLRIGTGAPTEALDVDGNAIFSGSVSAQSFLTTSDEKFKKDIHTIDNALDLLLKLRGVRYGWKDTEHFGEQTEIGFIAQELQPVLPEVVQDNGNFLAIKIQNVVAVVVEAIKELNTKVENYFARTERLEAEVAELRAEIELLKQGNTTPTQDVIAPEPTPQTQDVTPEPAPAVETAIENIAEPIVETTTTTTSSEEVGI